MGTRSVTTFKSEWTGEEIGAMYRHMDGYPQGHGKDLVAWGKGVKVVNGIGIESHPIFNGMSCAAADCIAHFKNGPGGIYLHPPGEHEGVSYLYHLSKGQEERLYLEVVDVLEEETIYKGFLDEYKP